MNIIELAKEAGFEPNGSYTVLPMQDYTNHGVSCQLERFAALVAAHEREKQPEYFAKAIAELVEGCRVLAEENEAAFLAAANLFTYDQVKAHIQAAVITEREACAKVCEEGTALTAFQSKDCYSYARNRAAAIRERSADLCQNSTELVETDVSEPPRHRYAGNFGE